MGSVAEVSDMLMIARVDDRDGDSIPTLKLDGKLLGPWVRELSLACEALEAPPGRLRLDLAAVTFIDPAGLALLGDLVRRGTTISGCTGFVEDLLAVAIEGGQRPAEPQLDPSVQHDLFPGDK
jgi:ABC-type transporter Mla MlaB component